METKVTTDIILATLQKWVEEKHPIGAETWLDACSKLNILLGDERAILYGLQQDIAKLRVVHMENGDTGIMAKAKVESSDAYRNMQLQKGKIDDIIEQIRISKLQARLGSDEYKSN